MDQPPVQDVTTPADQDVVEQPPKLVALPSPKKPRDPFAEHEARNIEATNAMIASAKANVEAVEISRESAAATMEAANAMNAMQAHFAEQRAMDRLRLVTNLLAAWTQGKPGRVDRKTISDAIATIDDLFELAEPPKTAATDQIASGENHESRP